MSDTSNAAYIRPIRAEFLPVDDGREFGALRGGGRAHAGVDFCMPDCKRVPVYASIGGKVIRYYKLPGEKYALEILNDNGTVFRYCGVVSSLRPGAIVDQGDRIATITPNQTSRSMILHMEYYKNSQFGSLTDFNNTTYDFVPKRNYQRRRDLCDPSFLATRLIETP